MLTCGGANTESPKNRLGRPASFRNGGRHQIGTAAGIKSESVAGLNRNSQANDRSGVDDITLDRLQPLAKAVLRNQPGASEALAQAARARAEELRKHKRVQPETEALRVFCGFLRKIFNRATAPEQLQTDEEGWRHCRRFAIEVLRIADIPHDFESHPDRLKEYLGTDVA